MVKKLNQKSEIEEYVELNQKFDFFTVSLVTNAYLKDCTKIVKEIHAEHKYGSAKVTFKNTKGVFFVSISGDCLTFKKPNSKKKFCVEAKKIVDL